MIPLMEQDVVDRRHWESSEEGAELIREGEIEAALTELQSVVIDAHFLVDQVARNRGGFFMNFNGTAGVWRRATTV